MLAELFVILLTVLSIAVGVPTLTAAQGFLYGSAVFSLALGHLVFRWVERRDAQAEQKAKADSYAMEVGHLMRLGADANSKLDLMSLKLDMLAISKNIPQSDPQYQEVRRIAESVASSVTQMYVQASSESYSTAALQMKSVPSTGAQQP